MLKIYEFQMHRGEVIAYAGDDGYMLVAANNKTEAIRIVSKWNKDADDIYSFQKRINNLFYKGKKAKIICHY